MTTKITPLPSSRHIDALIHQVFFSQVLMTGRGPFDRGITVPAYTSSIDAALLLKDRAVSDWSWNMKVSEGKGIARITKAGARSGPDMPFDDTPVERAGALCSIVVQAAALDNKWNCLSPRNARNLMALFVKIAAREDHDFGEAITLEDVLNELTWAVRASEQAPEPICA